MVRKSEPIYRWEGNAVFNLRNIRLAAQIVTTKEGNLEKKAVDCPWAWDGEVHFDAAKRLKGALVAHIGIVRPKSWEDLMKLGAWTSNNDGNVIGKVSELSGADEPPEDLVLPKGFEKYPIREFVVTTSKATRGTFHYVVEGPVKRSVHIVCCAKFLTPPVIEGMLKKVPLFLSDAHSLGYGALELLEFEVEKEEQLSV